MYIYGQNPWRCGRKLVYLHRNQLKTKDYVVLFMEATAAEEVPGQAAVDDGRGLYITLHGAAAI